MKKLSIWSIFMLLVMLTSLFSCGNDNEENNVIYTDQELVSMAKGKWMCTKSTDVQQGNSLQGLMVGKEITIYSNGTYSSTDQTFSYGTYSVSGNVITAKSKNGSTFVITVKINGNEMTWEGTASSGVSFTYVFKLESRQTTYEVESSLIIETEENHLDGPSDTVCSIKGIVSHWSQYVELQIQLEKIRLNKTTVHSIGPESDIIRETFREAYSTINNANYFLSKVSTSNDVMKNDIPAVRAVRAFVYYNLAMLWGDIPLITAPILTVEDADNSNVAKQIKQAAEVYQFAYTEISEVLNNLPESISSSNDIINKDAGRMLMAEIEMTRGNIENAKSIISKINKKNYEGVLTSITGPIGNSVICALPIQNTEQYIPVYTYSHITLFEKELSDNKEDLEKDWANASLINYGYWAALKRIGKAQEVTGCYEYELLMPFPPHFVQNPGYN